MRIVHDIDLLGDGGAQQAFVNASLVVAAVGLVGLVALAALGLGPATWRGWLWLAAGSLAAYAASLSVHELIHAALFKMLGPAGTKVRFGYERGMLYAGCPGVELPRGRFIAVLLAPLVVVSLACLVAGVALGAPACLGAWAVFALHASGCTGDLYCVLQFLRYPQASWGRDTERGITLLAGDGGE